MCSHMSRLKEGAPSQLQLLLCAALLSAALWVSPRGSFWTLKLNLWSSRICWPFTGWWRLGKCACHCSHMLLFGNISKPWTSVEQMHMIWFWQPRIAFQMALTCLCSSSKYCPAQGRSSPITGSIKCAMRVVICVIQWPTEATFLQVLPGEPPTPQKCSWHTEIMSLLTHA